MNLKVNYDNFSVLKWMLFFLLLAEVFFRQDWFWTLMPRSDTGVMRSLETHIEVSNAVPRIIFMGSSRMRNAVAPRVIEARLGLPVGSVLNLGLSSGGPTDAVRLYRRHSDRFRQASILVFGVEDWHFNISFMASRRFRQYASLDARLALQSMAQKADYVLGWFWKTWDARIMVDGYRTAYHNGTFPGEPVSWDNLGRMLDGNTSEEEYGPEGMTNIQSFTGEILKDYRLAWHEVRALQTLVRMASHDGLRVILVRLPLRQEYYEYVQQHYPGVNRAWRSALALALPEYRVIELKPEQVGLSDRNFVDYGHTAVSGTRILSLWLARWIATDGARPY